MAQVVGVEWYQQRIDSFCICCLRPAQGHFTSFLIRTRIDIQFVPFTTSREGTQRRRNNLHFLN